jgi:hypothetical protein
MPNTQFPVGAGATVLGLSSNADVSKEIGSAGMSFGKIIEFTGMAVADTQFKLNQTGAAMASALATTQVDVIAVQESIYDDDGNLSQSATFTRKLPLINFIDPVFYEWTAVRLQGQFCASEFVSKQQSTTSNTSPSAAASSSGNSGVLGILFGIMGSSGGGTVSTTTGTSSTVNSSFDRSFGQIRASALLEPKTDIGVPPPRQVIRGPSLNVVAGEIGDVTDSGGKLIGRTMSALLELNKPDGTPIQGKSISIETDTTPWSFSVAGAETTDASGQVAITLRRDFLGDNPDTAPKDVILSARLGLVF